MLWHYATCGAEDRSYAQPFERHHVQKHKWFSFAFNGQLANYQDLRQQLLTDNDNNHLSRDTDTEIIMHSIGFELSGDRRPNLVEVMRNISQKFDGAYSLVMLNSLGDMLVARDPLGIKPLCYAKEGSLFAAASESVALLNLGFASESIVSLLPGQAISIIDGKFEIHRFAASPRRAHCFFEWIYFANVASTMDGRSVYLSRKSLGEELARLETVPIDEDTIVVPVPDTSRGGERTQWLAFELKGSLARRIDPQSLHGPHLYRRQRQQPAKPAKVETKYIAAREVLRRKTGAAGRGLDRPFDDHESADQPHPRTRAGSRRNSRSRGLPATESWLPAFTALTCPRSASCSRPTSFAWRAALRKMPRPRWPATLHADSSCDHLPVESIARAISFDSDQLCQACITGRYPTVGGQQLYEIALDNSRKNVVERTYESRLAAVARQ